MTTGTLQKGTDPNNGYYYSKSWSGSDDTSVRIAKPPLGKPYTYYTWRRRKDGQLERVLRYHKAVPPRPPKRARSKGEHPYTMSLTEMNNPRITSWYLPWGPIDGVVSGTTGGKILNWVDPWTSNDDIKLIGKLKEAIQGSDFDLSLFLGTGHQTLDLIATSATKIAHAIKNVKRGNITGAIADLVGHGGTGRNPSVRSARKSASSDQTAASNWLELQYGWLPLLNDVHEGAKLLAHQLNTPARQTYRVRRKIEYVPAMNSSGYLVETAKAFSQGQIVARISENPSVVQMSGLLNPENLAWELLPWSFVADWFIPIGDYLAARSFASSLQGTFITTRVHYERAANFLASSPFAGPNYAPWSGGSSYLYKRMQLTRTVSTTLSVPMPTFKPLAKVASWAHAENAIALLTQLFHKR